MKIIIDDRIPYMQGFAEKLGEVVYLPGSAITAADVRDADALIIRTRTRCNRELLEGSRVRFIATATIGYDHLDTDYLRQAGIAWTNCPGCNAQSVTQYVLCSLLQLLGHECWHERRFEPSKLLPLQSPVSEYAPHWLGEFAHLTVGVVGCGHVGSEVFYMARRLRCKQILCCDPFADNLMAHDKHATFVSLETIAKECDIITFHTPLTQAPTPHPTYHLADEHFFSLLKPWAVVINASRGEVVDTQALKAALKEKRIRAAVVDTWENEPNIDRELLDLAYIATPHIAGYSADGKANGTRMALKAVAEFFGQPTEMFDHICPPSIPWDYVYDETLPKNKEAFDILRLYDPARDTRELKAHPEQFEQLRSHYPLRRESRH